MKPTILNEKIWNINENIDTDAVRRISEGIGCSEIIAKLLVIRNITTPELAKKFMNAENAEFYSPYLLHDMDKAVKRINFAIENNEKILIYGDYDVDGVTSVSVLYRYLLSKNANVEYYIPKRDSEGYGLNCGAIEQFCDDKIKLIITVDTGITAYDEVEFAYSKGIDVIITDHHECRENLPCKAVAIINPKRHDDAYPFKFLAGVGVVFKLICAIAEQENEEKICQKYLDLVCLGTIADVMPITDENRTIVVKGLKHIKNSEFPGIAALLKESFADSEVPCRITSSVVGFTLSPRINAAGRINDANLAAKLMITDNAAEAGIIARELCSINRDRQKIENDILKDAVKMIEENFDFEKERIIILSSDTWNQGVIGIVASRITEKYGLPCVLITFKGSLGHGSARSIDGFNINEAFKSCSEYLEKYGGHELAAGLSIEKEKFPLFCKNLYSYARENIDDETLKKHINADIILKPDEISISLAESLSSLEPFGLLNPAPTFVMKNVKIVSVIPVGNDKHIKLLLSKDGYNFTGMFFNKTPNDFNFSENDYADFLFNLDKNEYRGSVCVQFIIRDIKVCEKDIEYISVQQKEYLKAIAAKIVKDENIPEMQDFRAAFIFLRNSSKKSKSIDIFRAVKTISNTFNINISHCMMNFILDIFAEMNLIALERENLNIAKITVFESDKKVNLEDSKFLAQLKSTNKN